MFSISDIKQEAYPAAYRRGKELYERGLVQEFSYDVYTEDGVPKAELIGRVKGTVEDHYDVRLVIDEEYAEVSESRCNCEAFCNYEGICKHCVAVALAYVNRRQAKDILNAKLGVSEKTEQKDIRTEKELKTDTSLKNLLNRYSMRAGSTYLLPENIYGKVELEPYFKMEYSYATVEFKIGMEQKYVLKNISAFLHSIKINEKVRYGKKLEFYHHPDAFTESAKRMIAFMEQQEMDKRRQSQFHAYYAYTGSYERTMELDSVGIDRFFESVGDMPFEAEVGFLPEDTYTFSPEEKRPKLIIRQGGSGIFLMLEDDSVIIGEKYFYFYDADMIYRSPAGMKETVGEFFEFLHRQTGGQTYIAADELAMFCRDLLPLLKKYFKVEKEAGFDESLYVPPKPEFELYLDRQDMNTVGAKLMAAYGDDKYNVLEKIAPGEVRDLAEELRIKNLVEPYFNEYALSQTVFVLKNNEEMLYQLVSGGLRRLGEFMTIYTTENFRNLKVVSSPAVSVGISLKSDLLELKIHSDEMSREELAYLLSKYDRKKKYIRLKNGDFLNIEEDGLSTLAEVSEDLRLTETNLKKGTVIVPKYRAMYLDAALKNNQLLSIEKNKEFKGMVRNMKTIEDSDYEVPEALNSIMRSYQKNGFLWLKTLRENGFGGILADDMGLGKTLQVISLLTAEQEEMQAGEKELRRSLIVCPASLVYNWQKEITRFAPQLKTVIVAGSVPDRASIIRHSKEGEILITSYDLLKRDAEVYQKFVFAIQVIDEAQYIKNPSTQAAKGVKKITAAFKLALTGTPIENRLSELWSIFDYLMPGFLYTYQKFREEIELPIAVNQDANKMERLQRMIRPFILRRLKGDVLKDLPEKIEENVFARLDGEQMQLYDAYATRMKEMLSQQNEKEFHKGRMQILSELTKLRQLCCDPGLLLEDYHGESAKTDMCMELIVNAVGAGHKILLFSQFTSMLDRLTERLKKEGIDYYLLTGSVNKEKRMQMVESFNNDDVPVFCISLKAGGTGLNLTSADIVIHYDPWWNVAVQNQATDRAISYAVWWIRQSILQALAEQSRIVRLPLNQVGSLNKISKAFSKFEQENERRPSPEELADELEIPVDKISDTLKVSGRHISVDAPFVEGEDNSLLDVLVNDDSPMADRSLVNESLAREIDRALSTLTDREKEIIQMFFGIGQQEMTLEEIGDKFGLTRERVRQIKEKAIRRLRQSNRSKLLKSYLG